MASTASPTHESESDSRDYHVDPRDIRRAIQRRACELERQELDRAITCLESRGELTDEQKQILEKTATAITTGVLAGPESVLAQDDLDDRTLRLARELLTE